MNTKLCFGLSDLGKNQYCFTCIVAAAKKTFGFSELYFYVKTFHGFVFQR